MNQTERKQLIEKMGLVNELTEILYNKLRLKWDCEQECLIDSDNNEVDWNDFGSVSLDINRFISVSFWGDCTIELQETNGESVNVYNYNVATITAVVNALR